MDRDDSTTKKYNLYNSIDELLSEGPRAILAYDEMRDSKGEKYSQLKKNLDSHVKKMEPLLNDIAVLLKKSLSPDQKLDNHGA